MRKIKKWSQVAIWMVLLLFPMQVFAGSASKTYTFTSLATILAGSFNTNFDSIYNTYNAHDSATTGIHGMGSSTIMGTALTQTVTNKTLTSPTITTSPTAAGATWTDLGTVTTVDINGGTIDDTAIGGTTAAAGAFTTVTASTVTANTCMILGATKKLYLDGGGDTAITEGAANTIYFYAGSLVNDRLSISSSNVALGSGIDLMIQPTKKLYLDGGGDTYITEYSADRVIHYVGAAPTLDITPTKILVSSGLDLAVSATKKLYLDGGNNAYLTESSGDVIDLVANTGTYRFTASSITIPSTTRYYSVSPCEFQSQQNAVNWYIASGTLQNETTASTTYYAPVHLPHEATVTDLRFYWYRNEAAGASSLALNRVSLTLGGETQMATVASTNTAGAGNDNDSSISAATIDNTTYHYVLKLILDPDAAVAQMLLNSGKITYTVTSSLP